MKKSFSVLPLFILTIILIMFLQKDNRTGVMIILYGFFCVAECELCKNRKDDMVSIIQWTALQFITGCMITYYFSQTDTEIITIITGAATILFTLYNILAVWKKKNDGKQES